MDGIKYEFFDKTLFIKDKYSTCAIEWSNRPVAREQLGAGEWKDGFPHQRILVPAHIDAGDSRKALDSFALTVPKNIFTTVAPFKDHQWMMIRLMHSNPYAFDLSKSNPILAYCLANNQQFKNIYKHEISWEQANLYSRRKQKLILQWLGFPSTQIIVKLLKKIDCNEMSIGLMRLLKAALQEDNPTIKLLSHYKTITPGMLGLLRSSIAHLVTSELLADVANNPNERAYPHTAEKLTEIFLLQRHCDDALNMPTFLSVSSVKDFLDRMYVEARALMQRLHRLRIKEADSLANPPFEGNEDIIPITTKSQLELEGIDMKNCVRIYAGAVKDGNTYIYKILKPQRATLSIRKREDGVWEVRELKGKCNTIVSIETQAEINAWLRKVQN